MGKQNHLTHSDCPKKYKNHWTLLGMPGWVPTRDSLAFAADLNLTKDDIFVAVKQCVYIGTRTNTG